jgi:hypothetical protein
MPYSHLLMTLIFIKLRSDHAGATKAVSSRQRPGSRRKEAVMRTELQQFSFRAGVAEATNRPNPCVSTLSLCNANFGRS